MKVKEDFILSDVAGSHIVVPVGETSTKIHAIIELNETGAFLFELLQKDTDENALVSALCEKYDVDEQTAKADVSAFVDSLKGAGALDF